MNASTLSVADAFVDSSTFPSNATGVTRGPAIRNPGSVNETLRARSWSPEAPCASFTSMVTPTSSKGPDAGIANVAPPGNEMLPFVELTVTDELLSVLLPTFLNESESLPVSPLSRTPSESQLLTKSFSVAPTSARSPPHPKRSTTPAWVVLDLAGETAPTPMPRFANAAQNSW